MPPAVPRRASSRRALPRLTLALLPLLAGGCIHVVKGYPLVARTDLTPLVAAPGGRDTTWALVRPPFTVVGRTAAGVEVPGGLTGVARGWTRLFGGEPAPVTVVLVEVPRRGDSLVVPALPDSLARRVAVWIPVAAFDDGDRERRMAGPPPAGTPVMMGGAVGASASLQVAQAWLDERVRMAGGNATLPPWLRAGLVEALGGSPMRMRAPGDERRGAVARVPLDTLLGRRCGDQWAPIPRWRPQGASSPGEPAMRPGGEANGEAGGRAPGGREMRRRRERDRDPERAFEERMRDPCGLGLRMEASSFVRFLLDRGGDPLADALVRTVAAGGTLEQVVAGRGTLPATVPELERAWHAWEEQEAADGRR